MTTNYMLTIPRGGKYSWTKKALFTYCRAKCKKWIIGKETGQGGYEHWQVRLSTSDSFECLKSVFPMAHIEKCEDEWKYERKEGKFICSEDRGPVLQQRYGKIRENQRSIQRILDKQTNRGISVLYDKYGGNGKSWFVGAIEERGRGFWVPPYIGSVGEIVSYICSRVEREGYREIVAIDIPRSYKWDAKLCTALESIKDGQICDPRYHGTRVNIKGCKVLVVCNELPDLKWLSADRWDIWTFSKEKYADGSRKLRRLQS